VTSHGVNCDYEEVHDPGYENQAAKTFAGKFVPNPESPVEIYLSGPCPRCTQPMTYRHPIMVISGIGEITEETGRGLWDLLRRRGEEVPTEWSFTVICHCGAKHPKAPDDAPGCGAYWGMTVVRSVGEGK